MLTPIGLEICLARPTDSEVAKGTTGAARCFCLAAHPHRVAVGVHRAVLAAEIRGVPLGLVAVEVRPDAAVAKSGATAVVVRAVVPCFADVRPDRIAHRVRERGARHRRALSPIRTAAETCGRGDANPRVRCAGHSRHVRTAARVGIGLALSAIRTFLSASLVARGRVAVANGCGKTALTRARGQPRSAAAVRPRRTASATRAPRGGPGAYHHAACISRGRAAFGGAHAAFGTGFRRDKRNAPTAHMDRSQEPWKRAGWIGPRRRCLAPRRAWV
jgi:hypothetical protein